MTAGSPPGGTAPVTAAAGSASGIPPDLLGDGLADDLAAAALAMARRFRAGATMWCAAPAREPHAHQIAVEFGHPVIAGKPALPAFPLTGPDLVARARGAARSGDILVAVAGAGDDDVADLMRRAPVWGAVSVWIGSGPRPAAGAADHVLWIDDPDPMAPVTGQFVLLCHLLWELTHACFEHPGLPAEQARPECTDQVCVTCRDEGRLAEVITPPASLFEPALVRTPAGQEYVDVTLVAPVATGDLILVHAGAALTRPGGI